jgi:hypothetical protein
MAKAVRRTQALQNALRSVKAAEGSGEGAGGGGDGGKAAAALAAALERLVDLAAKAPDQGEMLQAQIVMDDAVAMSQRAFRSALFMRGGAVARRIARMEMLGYAMPGRLLQERDAVAKVEAACVEILRRAQQRGCAPAKDGDGAMWDRPGSST